MNNLRVIMSGNSSDGFLYRIEDVCEQEGFSPFCEHQPYGIACGSTVDELKKRLKEMLAACEKPPLKLDTPRLREIK